MKFVYQKGTKTLNQMLQDMRDYRFKEISRILPGKDILIVDFN